MPPLHKKNLISHLAWNGSSAGGFANKDLIKSVAKTLVRYEDDYDHIFIMCECGDVAGEGE